MSDPGISSLTPVYFADLPDAGAVNRALTHAFEREKDGPEVRRTHMFAGRYENTYIARQRLPELAPLSAFVLTAAVSGVGALVYGTLFNASPTGSAPAAVADRAKPAA